MSYYRNGTRAVQRRAQKSTLNDGCLDRRILFQWSLIRPWVLLSLLSPTSGDLPLAEPYPPAANNDYSELRLFLDKTALWLPALESGVPVDQGYGKDGEKTHSSEAQVTEDARRSLKAENPPSGERTNSW